MSWGEPPERLEIGPRRSPRVVWLLAVAAVVAGVLYAVSGQADPSSAPRPAPSVLPGSNDPTLAPPSTTTIGEPVVDGATGMLWARSAEAVYAGGHRSLSWRGRWLAAVLAAGEGAVLSHSSAAELWRFLRPIPGPAHVTVPSSRRPRTRADIVVHRSRLLPSPIDGREIDAPRRGRSVVTRRHGIAVTSAARTIEDVRGELEPRLFRRALRQAELAGHRAAPVDTNKRTRSDLELLFLSLCELHGLPRPEVNVRVGRHLVDFLFRAQKVAVETDSWTYHRGSVAFEDDHERDLALHALGLTVRRYTGDQLEADPAAVVADLRRALGLGV